MTAKKNAKAKNTRLSYKLGLPAAIARKVEKTGQTRGAEKDTVYQNRVLRSSTVLIPLSSWKVGVVPPPEGFENGYIVLAHPEEYFSDTPPTSKLDLPKDLQLGKDLLVFYETRPQWIRYPPSHYGWHPAHSRIPPLGGQYLARVPDTTSPGDSLERHGYIDSKTGGQGAGIRIYEYASKTEIEATRYQLSFLVWQTEGIIDMAREEGTLNPEECKARIEDKCQDMGLSDLTLLQKNRIIDSQQRTVCPLCLKPILAQELASRVEQAEGRNVPDLTVTTANLFHVKELKAGVYNHCRYNLGWGHHHCNAAARDWGVKRTLKWMEEVLTNNGKIIN
ncbi:MULTISPECIES: BstXI family restriction endonuclease [unclassified Microcoleus]|uniref:BstXI family restriction endonuclease n=1 Tax=unclassified Microcoleus TaxID=2642155 RepID=UPI002FD02B02